MPHILWKGSIVVSCYNGHCTRQQSLLYFCVHGVFSQSITLSIYMLVSNSEYVYFWYFVLCTSVEILFFFHFCGRRQPPCMRAHDIVSSSMLCRKYIPFWAHGVLLIFFVFAVDLSSIYAAAREKQQTPLSSWHNSIVPAQVAWA